MGILSVLYVNAMVVYRIPVCMSTCACGSVLYVINAPNATQKKVVDWEILFLWKTANLWPTRHKDMAQLLP